MTDKHTGNMVHLRRGGRFSSYVAESKKVKLANIYTRYMYKEQYQVQYPQNGEKKNGCSSRTENLAREMKIASDRDKERGRKRHAERKEEEFRVYIS